MTLAPASTEAPLSPKPPCTGSPCPGLLIPEQLGAATRLDGSPHFPALVLELEEIWAG